MISIRIECQCGQRYAFEVEPVGGKVPSPVACPSCGADGTEAANAFIAEASSSTSSSTSAKAPVRVALPTAKTAPTQGPGLTLQHSPAPTQTPRRPTGPLPGQISRTQAQHEARAKISWGDSPQEVLVYLLGQGFSHEEAGEILDELVQERTATVRGNGIKNIVIGILLILVPVVALIIFLAIGIIYVNIFLATIAVALYGVWLVIKGTGMLIAPKSEGGDVAEQ